jgi:glutamate--cysteine ligase
MRGAEVNDRYIAPPHMSLDLAQADIQPVTSVDELVEYFRQAERPVVEHRIGLEHEKFIYPEGGALAVPYEGEAGIGAVLTGLEAHGYTPFREAEGLPTIALMRGAQTVTLEPGGQVELAGSPFFTARQVHQEHLEHVAHLRQVTSRLGLRMVALGYRPFDKLDQMPWMPKQRYAIMRAVLPGRGRLARDMMLMTCTGQVSLDWSDEADCVAKTVLSARVAPLLVALYANSPLVGGERSGQLSYRSHVWTEVDPHRCGFLPSWFDGSFSYLAYVQWALDAPLLFLRRNGQYLAPALTFRQLLAEGHEGQPATYSDWLDHLSTLFPEVRLKKVLEIRGADAVDLPLTGALGALWRGLLYDSGALEAAGQILPVLSYSQHLELMAVARREGLRGRYRGISLAQAAQALVEVARRGLLRLDPEDAPLLEPLAEVALRGRSPAERVLEVFDQQKDPARVLAALCL